MQCVVDGILVNYKLINNSKDKTILFVHGWANSYDAYDEQVKALNDKYNFLLIDLPGFGRSELPQKAFALQDYAKFIKDFLDKIGIKINYAVGHSNGCSVLIKCVSNKLINVEKLILIAGSGIREDSSKKRIIQASAKIAKRLLTILPDEISNNIKYKFYSKIGSDYHVAPHLEESFILVTSEDMKSEANKVTIETLLIYGENDLATPVKYGQIYNSRIKGSKLEVVAGAGHHLIRTHAEEVAKIIKGFIK